LDSARIVLADDEVPLPWKWVYRESDGHSSVVDDAGAVGIDELDRYVGS
jgi:hypothetical protein